MGGLVKRLKYFGIKWAEQVANGPVGMPLGQKPLGLILFWRVPFSHFRPLLLPSFLSPHNKEMVYYGGWGKRWKYFGRKWAEQVANGPVGMPLGQKPLGVIHFWRVPFPIFCPCCFPPSYLPIIKKLFIMGGWVKRWIYLVTKWAEQAANGAIGMPQGQKPLGLIYFWRVPFSHFQPLMLPSFLFPQN